jgi:hypothetical protein
MCQVLIGLTWNYISFLDGRWAEILFGYMPISVVSLAIESESDVGKTKVVLTQRQKGITLKINLFDHIVNPINNVFVIRT